MHTRLDHHDLSTALKKLKVGVEYPLPDNQYRTVQAYYRAARKVGCKVTIRNLPNGTTQLWRLT